MNETTNLKLKKPAGNEYISVGIINGNMDIIDTGMKEISDSVDAPEFDASGTVGGITDKASLLASFVTKMPLVKFMRNVVAGFKLVLYAGQIVDNCVTNNAKLPLSAAQGKVLMDLYTVLNTKILELKSYTNEIKYRSYQTVIPIQESWIDGNICNIPFDITTALMTDKPYIFYVLPCSVIGHQVRYDYDLSTSTVAIVSIEFGAQLIAGNNVRFGIFIAGI